MIHVEAVPAQVEGLKKMGGGSWKRLILLFLAQKREGTRAGKKSITELKRVI